MNDLPEPRSDLAHCISGPSNCQCVFGGIKQPSLRWRSKRKEVLKARICWSFAQEAAYHRSTSMKHLASSLKSGLEAIPFSRRLAGCGMLLARRRQYWAGAWLGLWFFSVPRCPCGPAPLLRANGSTRAALRLPGFTTRRHCSPMAGCWSLEESRAAEPLSRAPNSTTRQPAPFQTRTASAPRETPIPQLSCPMASCSLQVEGKPIPATLWRRRNSMIRPPASGLQPVA